MHRTSLDRIDRIKIIIKEARYIFENFKDKKKKDITEEKCVDAILEELDM